MPQSAENNDSLSFNQNDRTQAIDAPQSNVNKLPKKHTNNTSNCDLIGNGTLWQASVTHVSLNNAKIRGQEMTMSGTSSLDLKSTFKYHNHLNIFRPNVTVDIWSKYKREYLVDNSTVQMWLKYGRDDIDQ